MARKMRRLAAVVLLCVSSAGMAAATHQPTHANAGLGGAGNCCNLLGRCINPPHSGCM